MRWLEGIFASEGVAIGAVWIYRPRAIVAVERTVAAPEAESARLGAALARAKEELDALYHNTAEVVGVRTAGIFQAQRLILEDPELLHAVEAHLRAGANAETALATEVERFASMLAGLQEPTLRQRAADVRDVGQRVLHVLAGAERILSAAPGAPAIVVAQDLNPSEVAQLNRSETLGIALARGGSTSHAAILARGLGFPTVVGLGDRLLDAVQNGMFVILDGHAGLLIVSPEEALLQDYGTRRALWRSACEAARATALDPAITLDGRRVEVVANLGDGTSAQAALAFGAEGVGVLRTEFLFLQRGAMPDEEEQYIAYRALATAMGSRPLIIRTLDIGGDKDIPYLDLGQERNPFLGYRAIRISLTHPEMLKTQLRAILRAAEGCNVKVMFPMIATLDELRAARRLLEEARTELCARLGASVPGIEVGIMVEVPSAAVCAPVLAREVDFVSLGTNDLIQYTLAADRTNERVRTLYDPLQPAVLHLVKKVIDDAHAAGIWAGVCGEMAADLDAVPLLLGMGLDEFSMNAATIPEVKALIRSLRSDAMQDLVARALKLPTAVEIRALVRGRSAV